MKLQLIYVSVFLSLFNSAVMAITYGQNDGIKHPEVGALVDTSQNGQYAFCSGTLISSTVFLTAAPL